MRISFEAMGGEFQAHRLDLDDCKYLAEQYVQEPDNFAQDNLSGGEDFSSVLFSGVYGPFLEGFKFSRLSETSKSQLDNISFEKVSEFTDNQPLASNVVDYYYVTEGKVHGYLKIENLNPHEFEEDKLVIEYCQIDLEGFAEKHFQIITGIQYSGYETELVTEDGGQEVYRHLTGYEIVDDEFEDYLIIHDTNVDPERFDFSLLSRIFG